jgi:hypothetical protein
LGIAGKSSVELRIVAGFAQIPFRIDMVYWRTSLPVHRRFPHKATNYICKTPPVLLVMRVVRRPAVQPNIDLRREARILDLAVRSLARAVCAADRAQREALRRGRASNPGAAAGVGTSNANVV